MSIELHCTQCAKLIRAPDNSGGQYGKCPYCGKKVYIPPPEDKIETYEIAEVDEQDEAEAERLRREAIEYAATVSHEAAQGKDSAGSKRPAQPPGAVVDTAAEVRRFVLAMRDSKLDEADRAVAKLKSAGRKSADYVQGLMLDEIPPTFENVPPPLLKGFLKTLAERLGS